MTYVRTYTCNGDVVINVSAHELSSNQCNAIVKLIHLTAGLLLLMMVRVCTEFYYVLQSS